MGVAISNIVMFGLILAVGMLVDGAIVVVEYADRRIKEGSGPMAAYTEAAKRMFWPVVSSTATTLCAFLPMLFWPGIPGEFMGMLPVTLIFVLSASLIVALIYLPVMGGVSGRFSRTLERIAARLEGLPWLVRAALVPVSLYAMFIAAMQTLNPGYLLAEPPQGVAGILPGALMFMLAAAASSVALTAARVNFGPRRIRSGYRRTPFGQVIRFIVANPVMPLVAVGAVVFFVVFTFGRFGENNRGVEFFVESEPEQAIIYVRARGNLSLDQKDDLVGRVEDVVLAHPAVDAAFAFSGEGGLNNNTGGAQPPLDTIGQVQIELVKWEDRPEITEMTPILGGLITLPLQVKAPEWDGDYVLDELEVQMASIPGIKTEILAAERGPASAKPVHLRIKGDDWQALLDATALARAQFDATPGLKDIEDTLPLPGIDWQIDVDVEEAGRYGANVATVGGMVQLVTRGLLLDTMRVDSSDEEIEIRVRLPEDDRVLSTLDSLKVRTQGGLVPLSNFISRTPVEKLGRISRVDQERHFDVKAGVEDGLLKLMSASGPDGAMLGFLRAVDDTAAPADLTAPDGTGYDVVSFADGATLSGLQTALDGGETATLPVNGNERIEALTAWLDTDPLPTGLSWEWTGDQEDQQESQEFLQSAFAGALGLMFIILLAQFNSFYNAVLVLVAVVMSVAGVLWGMMIMQQPFSIIMTGTGIVALAGIVVNNNIVLIDTYQDFSRYMPRIEAIIRTAEQRIRPVLLTTVTTMAGLASMMFGLSLDFFGGGYTINSPTALWWKQLATAVVFGLGIATVLTLIFTPAMLAIRVWAVTYVKWLARALARVFSGRAGNAALDWALARAARRTRAPEILWEDAAVPAGPAPAEETPAETGPKDPPEGPSRLQAAE